MSGNNRMNGSAKKNDQIFSKSEEQLVIKDIDTDVLFQKIFDKWYAFSMVGGECMMTEVPVERIEHFKKGLQK